MPTVKLTLPTFHEGQVQVWNNRTLRNAVRCGRRWGKTKMMVALAADTAAKGGKAGIFAPETKQLHEPYDELTWILDPLKRASSQTKGTFTTINNGVLNFWPLIDNELAGRGREYDRILVDEAAFTKDEQMMLIWEKSIEPTMATRPNADVWVFSTPNGINKQNFFYALCNDPKLGFKEHYAPSSQSPLVLPDFLELKRIQNKPIVFQQEYLAQFVDWSGDAFFERNKVLVDGRPVPVPTLVDTVFAVIDTAVKDRTEHDATAVSYFGLSKHIGHPLTLLDWSIISIQGAMLIEWLPTVFSRLEDLTKTIRTRFGVTGAFIEDKGSGTILLQQAINQGWKAHPIDSKLTAKGKSERALNVSGYWHQGLLKITEPAFDKVMSYRGIEENHWLTQMTTFRMGDKDDRRSDDLFDTACYGMAIGLGNDEGY